MTLWAHSVAIAVAHRRESARWFVETLGFRPADSDPEHWTTVVDPRGHLRLHLCEVEGAPGRRLKRSEVGNTGILLYTNEPIRRAVARLRKKGVRFSQPPRRFPWGWVAKFLDPDGNEFWLMPAP